MVAQSGRLKQRIVGALVLIALAVIFLPMLFKKNEQQQEHPVQVQAPAMPVAPQPTPIDSTPVVVDQPSVPAIVEPAAQPATPPVLTTPARTEPVLVNPIAQPLPQPVQVAPSTPAAPVKPAVQQVKPAAQPAVSGQWAVQLARSSDEKNAQQLSAKYRTKQYKTFVSKEAGFYYVRIGPLAKRDDAQQMCKQLKAREKQDCFVVSYKP